MVIIEGWHKPKNCQYCPFNESDCRCHITRIDIDRDDYTLDYGECPIREIEPAYGKEER